MNPSDVDLEVIRRRLREDTPPGVEIPRLNAVEGIICEILGEHKEQLKRLRERVLYLEEQMAKRR